MNSGYTIVASTHADFLYALLHKRIIRLGKCLIRMKNGDMLWFVPVNGKQHPVYGWTNTLLDYGEAIHEQYTAGVCIHDEFELDMQRILFNVIETPYGGRKYVFMGVFELDLNSDWKAKNRIWRKVRDDYDFSSCRY